MKLSSLTFPSQNVFFPFPLNAFLSFTLISDLAISWNIPKLWLWSRTEYDLHSCSPLLPFFLTLCLGRNARYMGWKTVLCPPKCSLTEVIRRQDRATHCEALLSVQVLPPSFIDQIHSIQPLILPIVSSLYCTHTVISFQWCSTHVKIDMKIVMASMLSSV